MIVRCNNPKRRRLLATMNARTSAQFLELESNNGQWVPYVCENGKVVNGFELTKSTAFGFEQFGLSLYVQFQKGDILLPDGVI